MITAVEATAVDRQWPDITIMVEISEGNPAVSRHYVLAEVTQTRPAPGTETRTEYLSVDGRWCWPARFSPNIRVCPACRRWLAERIAERHGVILPILLGEEQQR